MNTRKLLLGIFGAVLLIVIAVVLVAFLWWQSYKTGPAYSLALLF